MLLLMMMMMMVVVVVVGVIIINSAQRVDRVLTLVYGSCSENVSQPLSIFNGGFPWFSFGSSRQKQAFNVLKTVTNLFRILPNPKFRNNCNS
jgi:hypothetical protein